MRHSLIGHVIASAWFVVCAHTAVSAQHTAMIGRSFPGSPSFRFDAEGAVGPQHYAEITNLGFRVTALATGAVLYSATSQSQFWNAKVGLPLLTGCCFDPQLAFDQATGRWFAVSLSGAARADSAIYVGISRTSDPSGAWSGLIIDADPTNLRWADLPHLGFDGAGVYIAVGLPGIAATTPFLKGFLVLPKADLIGTVPTASRLTRFAGVYGGTYVANDALYGSVPQRDYMGTASDGLALSTVVGGAGQPTATFTGSGVHWGFTAEHQRTTFQPSGTATLPAWARTSTLIFDSPINSAPQFQAPDLGRQPGTATRLNNGGGSGMVRVGDTIYEVTSQYVRGRLGISWSRFRVSTNAIIDAGFIGDDVNDYLSPSISANAAGDVVIAYARVSSTSYASFYASAARQDVHGSLIFGPPMLIKEGSDIYDQFGPVKSPGIARFIDYASSVSVHPHDPSRFWVSGPYVPTRNIGATWIAEVIMLPQPVVQTTRNREILWEHTNGQTAKWVMNGLSASASSLLLGAGTGWHIGRPAAFDTDAGADLLWQHGDGRPALWLMNGLTFNGGAVLLGPASGWLVNRLADVNADGRSDILWQHVDGSTALWLMNGSTLQSGAILFGANSGWSVQHTGDFDGDGDADLVWQHTTGATAIWLMNGTTPVSGLLVLGGGTGWTVKAVGDVDGDSRSDLIWQHTDGSTAVGLMNGATQVAAGGLLGAGTGWSVRGVGDFDGNGRSDLFWQHIDGSAAIWLMNGLGPSASAVVFPAGTGWIIKELNDYNADGKSDLLWFHANGSTAMWLMDGLTSTSSTVLIGAGTGWSPVP